MAPFSLRQAAQQAGTSKSTILRAVQSGRLSASRTDDGGYAIEPAELFRVYPPKPSTNLGAASPVGVPHQSVNHGVGQDTPPRGPDVATELRIRNAALEAQIDALKQILEAEKRRADEVRAERDRWAQQAERLAIPAPAKRRWWRWA